MEILLTVLVAVSAFVATNLDDLFVLTIFFGSKDFNNTSVVLGQYIGILLLIIISLLAYFFKFIIPMSYIALFGIIPLGIGLKNIWNLRKKGSKGIPNKKFRDLNTGNCIDSKISRETILKVASVTFFNGGDNIGVYMSLFASAGIIQLILTNSIFIILVGVWCLISYFMVKNRIIGYNLERYGHIILPFVLILIGLVILSGISPIFYSKP
jgi:cadmium resistance protein CadD (predicted permease)